MRILYLTQRLPFGDGEAFIVPEIEALLAAGHEVLIVPRAGGGPVLHNDARELVPRTRVLPRASGIARAVFLARHADHVCSGPCGERGRTGARWRPCAQRRRAFGSPGWQASGGRTTSTRTGRT